MNISFNLSVDDWVAFQEFHRKKKTPLYGWMGPIIATTAIAVVVMGVWQVYTQGFTNYTWISVICFFLLLYLLFMRKKSKDSIRQAGLNLQQKNPEAFGPMRMDFRETGMDIQSEKASKSIAWNEMAQFEENRYYFFLYSKKGVVYIIPKKETGISDSEFKSMLNGYISTD